MEYEEHKIYETCWKAATIGCGRNMYLICYRWWCRWLAWRHTGWCHFQNFNTFTEIFNRKGSFKLKQQILDKSLFWIFVICNHSKYFEFFVHGWFFKTKWTLMNVSSIQCLYVLVWKRTEIFTSLARLWINKRRRHGKWKRARSMENFATHGKFSKQK